MQMTARHKFVMDPDLKDPEIVAAFSKVQNVLKTFQLTLETDESTGFLIATGPHGDMKQGRGKTLLGAVRDFLRANSG